jgi:hypothetical protein
MDISVEQKNIAYRELSDKEKDFIGSEEFTKTLNTIGRDNNLKLDQIGKLGDGIFLMLLGLMKSSELESYVKKELDIDNTQLSKILSALNDQIIIPFRKVLAEEALPENKVEGNESLQTNTEISTEKIGTREEILADIENPEPTIHPISRADQTIPGPARSAEITPEDKAAATSFIAGKLTTTITTPSQKAVFEEKQVPQKPKGYTADPYREPAV